SSARLRPMPWMCVSAIEMCLLTGILIPAMRAIVRPSTLSLLVARIRADHPDDALAPDDLAVAADPAHRSSYFHLCHSRPTAVPGPPSRPIWSLARSLSGSPSSAAPRT